MHERLLDCRSIGKGSGGRGGVMARLEQVVYWRKFVTGRRRRRRRRRRMRISNSCFLSRSVVSSHCPTQAEECYGLCSPTRLNLSMHLNLIVSPSV